MRDRTTTGASSPSVHSRDEQTSDVAPIRTSSPLEFHLVRHNRVGGKLALATVTASVMGGWLIANGSEGGSLSGGITVIVGYCLSVVAVALVFMFVGPRMRQIMPWGYSLNEYVKHRFASRRGQRIPIILYWMTVGAMLLYMFVYLGVQLTVVSRMLEEVFSFPLFESSIIIIAIVFVYAWIGGLKVSVLTDKIQVFFILPLLALCCIAIVMSLGGWNVAIAQTISRKPELLSWQNYEGIGFALSLIIAFATAELFNQANWQRVFLCKDDLTVRQSFLGTMFIAPPLILLVGLVGMIASGRDFEGTLAFFDLLSRTPLPNWVSAIAVLLTTGLVMSSMDSLFNGIIAVLTGEIIRYSWTNLKNRDATESHALIASRVLAISVALPVVVVALDNNVFYLFFVSNVISAGLAFPIFYSFFNRHQTPANALGSSILGIAAATLFLAKPDFTPLFNIPGGGNFLVSLAAGLFVSVVATLIWTSVDRKRKDTESFSYSELRDKTDIAQVFINPVDYQTE